MDQSNKLWKVSASAVESFKRCKRAWYNAYILNDREPSKPHQEKGTAVHAELEHYGKTGEVRPSEFIEIVQVGIGYLGEHPTAIDPYWVQFGGKAGLMFEQAIDMPTYEGGPNWIGYIDRIAALPDRGEVWDYKTTSDFRYAKTPEELLKNIQMQAYAHWLFNESDYKEILLKHLCLRMRGRAAAKTVEAVTTRAETEEFWRSEILPLVRQMDEISRLHPPTADVLDPSTDRCNDYGGCFYRTKCGFSNGTGERSFFKMSNPNDVLQNMLKMAGSVGVAAAAPAGIPGLPVVIPGLPVVSASAPVPTPEAPASTAPAVAQAPVVTSTMPASLAALLGQAASTVVAPATAPATDAAPPATSSPILPPDATSRVSTPEEVGPPPVVETAAPVADGQTVPPAATTAPAAEAPKRRGRPKKVEAETVSTAPAAQTASTEPAAPVITETTTVDAAAAALIAQGPIVLPVPVAVAAPALIIPPAPSVNASTESLMKADETFKCGCEVLFVDCLPQKGWPGSPPVALEEFMHSFARLAAASAKQPDYALIRYESKGYLRTAIRILMQALPKAVIVNSGTPGADAFLEVVTPYTKLIVRGTR